jgi:hypothetical protein
MGMKQAGDELLIRNENSENVLGVYTDPGTPADGDTNIAVREHQDNGGVTASLSDVSLGDMTIDGQRVLTVPNRAGATMPADVDASGNLTLQGNLVLSNAAAVAASGTALYLLSAAKDTALGVDDDPASPSDADTNLQVRNHQPDGSGGVDAQLDAVTLSNDGTIPAGYRALVVPARNGGGT